jgi:hypothetical protein
MRTDYGSRQSEDMVHLCKPELPERERAIQTAKFRHEKKVKEKQEREFILFSSMSC